MLRVKALLNYLSNAMWFQFCVLLIPFTLVTLYGTFMMYESNRAAMSLVNNNKYVANRDVRKALNYGYSLILVEGYADRVYDEVDIIARDAESWVGNDVCAGGINDLYKVVGWSDMGNRVQIFDDDYIVEDGGVICHLSVRDGKLVVSYNGKEQETESDVFKVNEDGKIQYSGDEMVYWNNQVVDVSCFGTGLMYVDMEDGTVYRDLRYSDVRSQFFGSGFFSVVMMCVAWLALEGYLYMRDGYKLLHSIVAKVMISAACIYFILSCSLTAYMLLLPF